MRKTDLSGIKLSELNPYVKQVHFPEGLTPENTWRFERIQPNLIYEEVDHLPTKILARRLARQANAALIMATDTGDRTIVWTNRLECRRYCSARHDSLCRWRLCSLCWAGNTSRQGSGNRQIHGRSSRYPENTLYLAYKFINYH